MDDEGLRGQTYRCSRTASEGSTGNVLKISASGIVKDEPPIEDVELWMSYQIERC